MHTNSNRPSYGPKFVSLFIIATILVPNFIIQCESFPREDLKSRDIEVNVTTFEERLANRELFQLSMSAKYEELFMPNYIKNFFSQYEALKIERLKQRSESSAGLSKREFGLIQANPMQQLQDENREKDFGVQDNLGGARDEPSISPEIVADFGVGNQNEGNIQCVMKNQLMKNQEIPTKTRMRLAKRVRLKIMLAKQNTKKSFNYFFKIFWNFFVFGRAL